MKVLHSSQRREIRRWYTVYQITRIHWGKPWFWLWFNWRERGTVVYLVRVSPRYTALQRGMELRWSQRQNRVFVSEPACVKRLHVGELLCFETRRQLEEIIDGNQRILCPRLQLDIGRKQRRQNRVEIRQ